MQGFEADIAAIGHVEAIPRILDVVCRITGMGFAAVARVTEQRWICCASRDEINFGLTAGGELDVETTICHEIRQSGEAVIIDNVAEDGAYCGHPTPLKYGFQSYISMPIILANGSFFGTLCAIDPRPARLKNPETIGMFKLFAELIAFHLDAIERLSVSEASLLSAQKTSELREQFIAILGHDLRNPLASIAAGATLLARRNIDPESRKITDLMQLTVKRMARLIDNVLDFARGRLGGGLSLDRDANEPLKPVLETLVTEYRTSAPDRKIVADFDFADPIDCDRSRMGQLFSNLLGNAVAHGASNSPIRVTVKAENGIFSLSVANEGKAIPESAREKLFQPFSRGGGKKTHQGLGLGLYIASQIARSHGGTLTYESTPAETKFTFRMPV
jgi:signal transduction histidine kinase